MNNTNKPPALLGLSTGRFAPRIDLSSQDGHIALLGAPCTHSVIVNKILQAQIRAGGGAIFVDATNDDGAVESLCKEASALGRSVTIVNTPFFARSKDGLREAPRAFFMAEELDPYERVHDAYVVGLNPLAFGEAPEVASRMVNSLLEDEGSAGYDYRVMQITFVLTSILAALFEQGPRPNVLDLAKVLNSEAALEDLGRSRAGESVQAALARFRSPQGGSLDMTKLRTLLGGFSGRLVQLGTGNYADVFAGEKEVLDLRGVLQRNEIAVLRVDCMGKNSLRGVIARMFLAEICGALRDHIEKGSVYDPQRPPFLIYTGRDLDECQGATFLRILELATSSQTSVVWSRSNVEASSPQVSTMRAALACTDNSLVLRPKRPSEVAALYETFAGAVFAPPGKGQGLFRKFRRGASLFSPERLLGLKLGHAVLISDKLGSKYVELMTS